MQTVPQLYDAPEPSRTQPDRPRIRKTKKELLVSVLTSVRFWGGLSVLVAFVSLDLPWWGVTVGPNVNSSYWGLFFGPQSQQTNFVVFFRDRLDSALAANYTFMTTLVLLTSLSTIIGAILRRALALTVSLTLAVITVLSFLADVGSAVSSECAQTLVEPASCISGLVGQGTSGLDLVTWGFQAGFYTFIASTMLLVGTLALQATRKEQA